jgi:hypothetical protein
MAQHACLLLHAGPNTTLELSNENRQRSAKLCGRVKEAMGLDAEVECIRDQNAEEMRKTRESYDDIADILLQQASACTTSNCRGIGF